MINRTQAQYEAMTSVDLQLELVKVYAAMRSHAGKPEYATLKETAKQIRSILHRRTQIAQGSLWV